MLNNLNDLNEASFKILLTIFMKTSRSQIKPNVFDSHVRFICDNFEYIKITITQCIKHHVVWKDIYHMYMHLDTSRPRGFVLIPWNH